MRHCRLDPEREAIAADCRDRSHVSVVVVGDVGIARVEVTVEKNGTSGALRRPNIARATA